MLDTGHGAVGSAAAATRKLPWLWGGLVLIVTTAVVVATVFALTRNFSAAPVASGSGRAGGTTGALARHPAGEPGDTVGTLFTRPDGHLNHHFCTASVVASKSGDLIITAAHCLTNISLTPIGSIVFAPGYANGRFPRGIWAVTRKFVDAQWKANENRDDDVAFLEVRRLAGHGVPADQIAPDVSLQRAAGAEQLRFGAPLPATIRAVGYPDRQETPVSCRTRAVAFQPGPLNQVKFVCPGFTDGTSGGPFLTDYDRASGTGTIIGVIGGYQQGGNSPGISYSSAFTASIRALYRYALRAS
jgi:hypothetical protein